MSELLDALIEQRRKEALEYKDIWLSSLINKEGQRSSTWWCVSQRPWTAPARGRFTITLGKNERLALAIHDAANRGPGWLAGESI